MQLEEGDSKQGGHSISGPFVTSTTECDQKGNEVVGVTGSAAIANEKWG